MMSRLQKGMLAGLAATVTVSALDLAAALIQQAVGERWFHSFPTLLAAMAGEVFGSGANHMWVGWLIHFVVGAVVLGGLFAILAPRLPTDTAGSKGILFAVGAWLVMCLTVMPLAGLGMFGAAAGFGTVAWMLVSHVIFGLVMGRVFERLHGEVGHPKRIKPIAA